MHRTDRGTVNDLARPFLVLTPPCKTIEIENPRMPPAKYLDPTSEVLFEKLQLYLGVLSHDPFFGSVVRENYLRSTSPLLKQSPAYKCSAPLLGLILGRRRQ